MADKKAFVEYPKWVDHPTDISFKTKDGKSVSKRVLVKNEAEEIELLGNKKKVKTDKADDKKSDSWQG